MNGSILYDMRGRPIASPELRTKAEELLKEFMAKHHDMFQQWFRAEGIKRPPIFFNTDKIEWVWVDP